MIQDVLHILEDAHQLQSQPWAYGSYWYPDGVCPHSLGSHNSKNLLEMASLNKVACHHYSDVYHQACNEWQYQEAEVHSFQMGYTLYNVHVFVALVLAAISHKVTAYIKHVTHGNIHLLNDGPFVWITLFLFLFPSGDIYDTIIHQQLCALTLASCNNNFDKYAEKFQHLFKPV